MMVTLRMADGTTMVVRSSEVYYLSPPPDLVGCWVHFKDRPTAHCIQSLQYVTDMINDAEQPK